VCVCSLLMNKLNFVLQAFCPVREIPKGKVHENVLEAFSIKDKVRGMSSAEFCGLCCVMWCPVSRNKLDFLLHQMSLYKSRLHHTWKYCMSLAM